ncbi:MAG: polysaccharide deacetylase family protein [Hyphomicrobiaceae bacterium]
MPYSKRVAAATAFGTLGLATVLSRIASLFRHDIRILIYHRVVDPNRAYDAANVSATPDQFGRQLDYIAQEYDVIGFADLLAVYKGRQTLPKRPLLITFDDGFADNYAFAFPALSERNLTAAFFVTTEHIGQRELFWFDKIGFLLRHARETSWDLLDGRSIELVDRDHASVLREILERLKSLPNAQRLEQVRILEERTLDGTEAVDEINFPMTWAQLEEMLRGGMEIYSHTCTHPVLSTVQHEDEIRRELTVSKDEIEKRLGSSCDVFAYPVGRWSSYDERALRLLKECGYELACINESGTNHLNKTSKLELYRIPVDAFQNDHSFKSLVAQPGLFAY